jgi:aspartyl-tRNA(Asn)/glutamyl-tRNA(Gln) amidotransferase subunit C
MSLSAEDVQRIANLARLELDPAEQNKTLLQLNQVFELIERLKSVDTSDVVPMTHATDLVLRLRDDVVTEPDRREVFQAVAPQVERGLYLVPKVIE